MAEMCGVDLATADLGIDGCGVPSIAMPLHALVLGMARLADPAGLHDSCTQACGAIVKAMVAHPLMVAGTGPSCAALMETGRGRYVVKGAWKAFMRAPGPRKAWASH
ncbi:MAG: hypothetical protein CMM46_01340 [Rhodospirillaceae bacterium]|nr:hypothetical protein [Rhodospirillaceae bacterium]|tara:strand:+ start:2578 stop:2898 length:321 start_codon:yes stop_codon:yes gene_type:complete